MAYRYSLLAELRVLLVHGLLHLCGFDHEKGEQQSQQMAQLETQILTELGWEGSGLINAAEGAGGNDGGSSSGTSGQPNVTKLVEDSSSAASSSSSVTVERGHPSSSTSSTSSAKSTRSQHK